MRGKLIFITGGIRSGKSELAEEITSELGSRVVYIATSQIQDEEMKKRVEVHRQRRPENWQTVEEPQQVAKAITEHGPRCDVIMLDCLTGLISNLMFFQQELKQDELQQLILNEIQALATAAREADANVVIVSNEVGMSLVSDNYLGRRFQDLVGKANQIVAHLADEAYFVVAGHPIDLKRGRGAN